MVTDYDKIKQAVVKIETKGNTFSQFLITEEVLMVDNLFISNSFAFVEKTEHSKVLNIMILDEF